jgi:double-stranded uracil-DNA glycosylase
MPEAKLPDLLANDLAVVFCGTAAGAVSAKLGQYYAHPRNLFWTTLHEIGLTRRRLEPGEFRALLDLGVGLTDIAKYDAGMDHRLASGSLGRPACDVLRVKIEHYRPRILAFTSLRGGRSFLGREARFGEQDVAIGATRIWVLPSPSPAARWNWDEAPWRELAKAARPHMKL